MTAAGLDELRAELGAQVGDMQRIPFVIPSQLLEEQVSLLSRINKEILIEFSKYVVYEPEFNKNPISLKSVDLSVRCQLFLNSENYLFTQVLLNETVINEKVFEIYELTSEDRAMVLAKEGESIGAMPVG